VTSTVRNNQCDGCPWRVSVTPARDIPGYCPTKHAGLADTIAESGVVRPRLRAMSCHESPPGAEQYCVGWAANQLGPGNNLTLRMVARDGRFQKMRTDGPQHLRFEDTLPKKGRRR
jgi:hypothetical protein